MLKFTFNFLNTYFKIVFKHFAFYQYFLFTFQLFPISSAIFYQGINFEFLQKEFLIINYYDNL